ncbi:MAG: guanylate kinase [Clostridia bacterium]|nr:guanylate kinase [Clostridia bacterium]
MSMTKKGTLMVVSGPAGVGKGTIVKLACEKAKGNIHLSISATTRNPRPIDKEGVTYYFKTKEEFQSMIEHNEVLEWAEYVGNYYGTPRKPVEEALSKGVDVILEIEVQGAMQIKKNFPGAVLTFVAPPSREELENRLRGRGTETEEQILSRLKTAEGELSRMNEYDYIVVNDQIEQASEDLLTILRAEKLKQKFE